MVMSISLRWRYRWALWCLRRGDPRPMQILSRRWLREAGQSMAPMTVAIREVGAAIIELMPAFQELRRLLAAWKQEYPDATP